MLIIFSFSRLPTKDSAVQTIVAHGKKVNVALFTKDNTQILTAGRDNSIRLWDTRVYADCRQTICKKNTIDPKVLQVYNQHQCEGYNVSTCFMGNEKYIITGSEDNNAYIYETETGKVVKTLKGNSNVVHLLDVQDDHTIATSSIDNVRFFYFNIFCDIFTNYFF